MDEGSESQDWIDDEFAASRFSDVRLGRRLRQLVTQMAGAVGGPIPLACQDWANTKAAYRFLSNSDVSEGKILQGHFQSTALRVAAVEGPILVLQDTTEFSYERKKPEQVGAIGYAPSKRETVGIVRRHTICGLLMHSSLVVTTEGLPLGLAAIKFWSRSKFKGSSALKRHINPTRVPIEAKESIRWLENMRSSTALLGEGQRLIHIGDRENDIYEFFCAAREAGTHFLVRTCVDRLAGDGKHTIAAEMADSPIAGRHMIEIADGVTASLALKYKQIRVLPPIGKQKRYPALDLTIVHAQEQDVPENRSPIDWKLITDLPITSLEGAVEKLQWYALRWKIEVFHKILKSGCRAEDAKLRTAERLVNLLAIYCVLSWRMFWMTMINRTAPTASPDIALTKDEIDLIDRIVIQRTGQPPPRELSSYLTQIARLGGYLARQRDPPPGNTVIWRGWSRLMDMKLGIDLAGRTYG
ncbi:IS4 family transposase [Sphingobium lactosutens]|uniref:IS4 family transposase n=1 Tax=Sphingobium lactosutens TaxID=522773 RepID=UPI0015BD98B3|nr:IS4 family transposase [Sphingobium lactosutens]NWK96231.1 IS4 family transposase [Sphingobium lactosutens]NWK96379.1 IS4 family transposase [Sphingobium lactosutens]